MDASRFDRLAQSLAGSGSRRRLLRALAAAPLATALALSRGESQAREGAYDGRLGGRHGKDRRGRDHRHRDRHKRNDRNPPPQSRPPKTCRPNGDGCIGDVPCCEHLTCTPTIVGIPSCQAACDSDDHCHRIYPNLQTSCGGDVFGCPFIAGGKCCSRTFCDIDAHCQGPTFVCRSGVCRRKL